LGRKGQSLSSIIVWFNLGFRLSGQPALSVAAQTGRPVIPCYAWDDIAGFRWNLGGKPRFGGVHFYNLLRVLKTLDKI